jgi:hypothetical protein
MVMEVDFFQVNAFKKQFHILNAVDGHTNLAHFPDGEGVIAIITNLGGEVEGHTQSLHTLTK